MLCCRHIPSVIIFLLNFFVFASILCLFVCSSNPCLGIVICTAVTLLSLIIVVSPLGDKFVLHSMDVKVIKAENTCVAARLLPLFREVMSKARHQDNDISANVQLYIADDENVNAYAVGRRIVCLTQGAVNACDDETLCALLAHEFGHLSHHDSEANLMIYLGMLPVGILEKIIRFFTFFTAVKLLYYVYVAGPCWLLKQLIRLLQAIGSQAAENGADAFCVHIGYGRALKYFMEVISYSEGKSSLLDSIFASHPASDKRVRHIEQLLA